MTGIRFSKEQKASLVRRIQRYFQEELDQEIEQFPAEFLLDFFTKEIGPYYYNQGLYDAQGVLESKMEAIAEAIYEIEKTTEL